MSSRRHERDRDHRGDGRRGDGNAERRGERRGPREEMTSTSQAVLRFGAQDPKVISIFEVLGAYYVDVFFNHLYAAARKNAAAGDAVTDTYRAHVQSYLVGVKNDDRLYSQTVQGVHRFFGENGYTTWTFADFVDRVVGCFVPAEYYRQMKTADKDEILSSVVCDLVGGLAVYATQPDLLRRVIDQHDAEAKTTIRMMQDACVSAQIQKRDEIHNKFVSRLGQAREGVSTEMFEKLKRALRQLAAEKADAECRAERAEEKVEELRDRLSAAASMERKLRRAIDLLTAKSEGRGAQVGAAAPTPDRLAERPLAPLPAAEDRLAERPAEDRLGEARADTAPGRHGVGTDFFKVAPMPAGGAPAAPHRSARDDRRSSRGNRQPPRGERKAASASASDDESASTSGSDADSEEDDGLGAIQWTGQ